MTQNGENVIKNSFEEQSVFNENGYSNKVSTTSRKILELPNVESKNSCNGLFKNFFIGLNDVYCIECNNRTENIIAFVWSALLFFVGVIFAVAQYTTTLKRFSFTTNYWVLFVFLILSIFGMSVAIFYRNNKRFTISYDDFDDETEKCNETLSKNLIGCAYIFTIGNLLLDMFSIVTVFHCGFFVTSPTENVHFVIQFLFHAARAVYMPLQILFVQVFHGTKIHRSFQFLFKLLIVQMISTNFCIWFALLCQETGIFPNTQLLEPGEYTLFNCSTNPNDDMFNTASRISIYLQPFVLEYVLLLSMMLYFMYPIKVFSKEPDKRRKYNYGAVDSVKRDDSKVYKSDPGVLMGIIVSTVVLLSSWSVQCNTHFLQNLVFKYMTEIIVHLLVIVAAVCITREICSYHSKENPDRKYKIEDYLLLITGLLGYLPFFIAVIFSVSKQVDYTNDRFPKSVNEDILAHQLKIRILLGLLAVINIAAVLVQMYFLMTSRSYKRVAFGYRYYDSSLDISDWKKDYHKLRSSARIGQWLIFLFILNVTLWVSDTFFGVQYIVQRSYWISEYYWGERVWLFIHKLLYPLLIFYRFHSAVMIVSIWINFRVKKKLF